MGWMVLPQFQGKGIGSQAARQILDMARSQKKFQFVHAFPGIANIPSNAICKRAGFSKLEECEVEYAGRTLRCNHWLIQVF
jgi:RimJ/RimL family protein N-acetyltransferase